jgi:ketosteroid isomerase-like protein
VNSQQRKDTVRRLCQAWLACDPDAALAAMADNVAWLVPGNEQFPPKHGKAAIREHIAGIRTVAPEGFSSEFHKIHDSGDSIIVELTVKGPVANGRYYHNEYCIVFDIPNEKVECLRFYTDFAKVAAVFRS